MSLRKSSLTPLAPIGVTSKDATPITSAGPTSESVTTASSREETLPAEVGAPETPAQVLNGLPQAPAEGVPAVSLSPSDQSLTYRPTEAQQRVKARFWSRWSDIPGREPTLAVVKQLTGSAAVVEWWAKPGFKDWFLNTSVTEERLSYLLHLALSAAEDILLNTDAKAQGARVAMVKTVADMSGKLRSSQAAAAKGAGGEADAVKKMTREQLVQLLQDSGLKVEQVVNLPIPSERSKT